MTAAHLDHDALADLAEGILDGVSATSAQAHLSGCAECRDRAAEIAEVTRVLVEAPIPPMPAHLVERLDAAIAAEAASQVTGHRHGRRFQFLAAAAAAVVVVGGGVVARTVIGSRGADNAVVSQRPVEEPSRAEARGVRPRPEVAEAAPYTAVRSGRRYTSAALAAQVATALSARPSGGRHVLTGAAGLDGCVERVGSGRPPLLVDSATFDGRPATVIALSGGDAHQADIWVVGPHCSADDTDLIAHRKVAR